ncbi:MAG: DUF805 domain-containing protein [Clostridia bacterium]|nr:DUF805 domain-containing protein [Clostridia bacterium]
MTFVQAVKSAALNYSNINGRASRSEYWWYQLTHLAFGLCYLVAAIFKAPDLVRFPLQVVSILMFVPVPALTVRRLHDVGHSGWWAIIITLTYLINLFSPLFDGYTVITLFIIWLASMILLTVWLASKGKPGVNKYGENPIPPEKKAKPKYGFKKRKKRRRKRQ